MIAKENEKSGKKYLLCAILIVGLCMRPSLTGIGSLLRLIKPDMGLSDTAAGMLTTIPMLAFAAFSPVAGVLNRKLGTYVTLITGLSLIVLGIVVRSYLGLTGLIAGTLLIGIGISFGNVLMPAIIKKEFKEKYGIVTALNSAALAISSGIASGINYPLASSGLGWRNMLCLWAVPVVISIVAWLPVRYVNIDTKRAGKSRRLLKNGTAWSVTLFLGIVALLFYSFMSWLSSIFQDKGLDAETAGYYVSAFQMTGIISSFVVPALAGKSRDQRKTTFAVLGIFFVGILLLIFASSPAVLMVGALMSGFACNGCFALSMAFIGFRAANGEDAAELSSMSQSVGYLIAAVGPMGMGFVYSAFGSWNVNLWIIAALIAALFIISNKCARDETV
ncbi:MAG: CynX/NimT family MFS transporter [Oscillospiraceae bacterium]